MRNNKKKNYLNLFKGLIALYLIFNFSWDINGHFFVTLLIATIFNAFGFIVVINGLEAMLRLIKYN